MLPVVPLYLASILGVLYAFPKLYKGYFPNYAEAIILVVNKLYENYKFSNASKTGMYGNFGYGLDVATKMSNEIIEQIIDRIHQWRLSGKFLWNNTDEFKKASKAGGSAVEINKRFSDAIQNKITELCTQLQADFANYNLTIAQIRLLYNGIDGIIKPSMGEVYSYFWGVRTRLDTVKLGVKLGLVGVGAYYGYKAYKGKLLK